MCRSIDNFTVKINFKRKVKNKTMAKKPYAIIIMDGYGIAPAGAGNAIELDGSKNVHEIGRAHV